MTGKLIIKTSNCEFVKGNRGPLVRFSLTWGFVTAGNKTEPGVEYLEELDGCLGSYNERDGMKFTWHPPLHKIFGKARQLISQTPALHEAVIEALRAQGVLDKYQREWEEVRGRKDELMQKKEIHGIEEVGQYVVE